MKCYVRNSKVRRRVKPVVHTSAAMQDTVLKTHSNQSEILILRVSVIT